MNPKPQPKQEPVPASSQSQPADPAKPRATPTRPVRGAAARGGRAASRARGRGKVVVPRQVPRRKLSAKKLKEHQEVSREQPGVVRGRGGRGRGRGRGGRGGRVAPTYAPNVVGLGQIAPPKPSKALSSGGSADKSRRSSVVSSVSVGGVSSTGGMSSSTMGEVLDGVGGMSVDDGGAFAGEGKRGGAAGRSAGKVDQKLVSFEEHYHVGDDSDDDMPESEFDHRNCDISPYAGKVTNKGLLLPVSLAGLRDLPPEYNKFEAKVRGAKGDSEAKPVRVKAEAVQGKQEPVEIESEPATALAMGAMTPEMFEKGTVAHHILSSKSALMYMQLPGLLALSENEETRKRKGYGNNVDISAHSSVMAASAAAQRIRGLGTDLRCVGETGSTLSFGKLRFYQSGRVQLVMEPGGAMDVILGVQPKVCHQAVLVDKERTTCEELESTVMTRLVAVPDMGPL